MVVLIVLSLACLFTGQPWNGLYAAIVAGWIAKTVDAEAELEAEFDEDE